MWMVRSVPVTAAIALALGCACASPPAARPQPRVDSTASADQRASLADASFMRGMITHHAQALYMTRLVPSRSRSMDVRTLAERVDASQRGEIALMSRWLAARGQPVPDTSHTVQGHDLPEHRMPGMLVAEELRALSEARGDAFDRLFLTLMIRHHEGALAMVSQLLSRPGGGQDAEAYRFAADVDADQRAEIARMRRMLSARGSPDGAR
jgi:uncharacterized protein (DUF305 family)